MFASGRGLITRRDTEIAIVKVKERRIQWYGRVVNNPDAIHGLVIDDEVNDAIDVEVRPIGPDIPDRRELLELDVDFVLENRFLVGTTKVPTIVRCSTNDRIDIVNLRTDMERDAS